MIKKYWKFLSILISSFVLGLMATFLLPAFSATPKAVVSIYLIGDILTMIGDRPNFAEDVAVNDG